MKTASANLQSHLAGEVTTTATLWLVTRTDGQIFGFTDHNQDIVYSARTYVASTGYTASAIESTAALTIDNLEIESFFDSAAITEADLMAGKWNHATVEVMLINYAAVADGVLKLKKGRIGEIRVRGDQYAAELQSLSQALEQIIGEVYTPTCRADLFDTRCKLTAASYAQSVTVTAGGSQTSFSDSALTQADDYFGAGKIVWATGSNAGLSMEIKSWTLSTKTAVLMLPMPYVIQAGDTATMYPGCRKRFAEDCITKFSNAVNFRGEPDVPGIDAIIRGPG